MNAERTKLILWSPHLTEHFIVVSSSIRLYEKRGTGGGGGLGPQPPLSSTAAVAVASRPPSSLAGSSSLPSSAAATPSSSPSTSASLDSAASPYWLLDTVTYPQQSIRAVAWSTSPQSPLLVGAGLLSGKLALIRLQDDSRPVKEFDPRYQRQCHAVAFSPHTPHHVAVGLERQRSSPGVLVWDLNQRGVASNTAAGGGSGGPHSPSLGPSSSSPPPPPSSSTLSISSHGRSAVEVVTEALVGVSLSEASTSLAWAPASPSSLAVGTGSKWLRIYDLRAGPSGRPTSVVAHSKQVQGVRYDPFQHERIATFSEDGVVKVWDQRLLTAPVYALNTAGWKGQRPRPVVDLEWCATSASLLSTVSKEEDTVRLWDLSGGLPHSLTEAEAAVQGPELSDCPPLRRVRATGGGGWLSALSWHPRHKQRLLLVSKGGVVEEQFLHDDFIAAWDPRGDLCVGLDDRLSLFSDDDVRATDVGARMRLRCQRGYGLDVEKNRQVARQGGEEELERVWEWMAQSPQQAPVQGEGEAGDDSTPASALPYEGVMASLLPPEELSRFRAELRLRPSSTSPSPSAVAPSPSSAGGAESVAIQPSGHMPPSKVYLSPGRVLTLQRCGWFDVFTPPSSTSTLRRSRRGGSAAAVNLESRLRALEERGEHERACMLAVVHLDLRRGLQSLTLGAAQPRRRDREDGEVVGTDLGLVALALAGYQSNPAPASAASSLWSRTFPSSQHLKALHPHLKAVFSFLSLPHPRDQSLQTFHDLLSSSPPLLSFQDRLAFACRFLPDADLFAFIRQAAAESVDTGQLDGLLLTGLTPHSGCDELLQKHCDVTADVQTVALLAVYGLLHAGAAAPGAAPATPPAAGDGRPSGGERLLGRFERWVAEYRALLNQWRMWTERAKLDVARALLHSQAATQRPPSQRPPLQSTVQGRALGPPQGSAAAASSAAPATSAPSVAPLLAPSVLLRCVFCSQPLNVDSLHPRSLPGRGGPPSRRSHGASGGGSGGLPGSAGPQGEGSFRVKGCPHCKKSLPRCALCLVALDVALPAGLQPMGGGGGARQGRPAGGGAGKAAATGATPPASPSPSASLLPAASRGAAGLSGWFSWCQHCRHGGHAQHLRDWFQHHSHCPVYPCQCRCADRDIVELEAAG